MIIPMLCVTIFVILVVWFLLPRVARLMIHTPTAISIFVCLSMVQLMAVFRSEERFSRNAETDLVCRLLLEKKKQLLVYKYAGFLARSVNDGMTLLGVGARLGVSAWLLPAGISFFTFQGL